MDMKVMGRDAVAPVGGGTDWPKDAFTLMVTAADGTREIATPARSSYDGDGNMSALDAFPPLDDELDHRDLATYTGATGPGGA